MGPKVKPSCLFSQHLLNLLTIFAILNFKGTLSFPWDLECLIDDWIMMGCLVGNDFIPHLPRFHIHKDALPTLWNAYMKVLPTLDGKCFQLYMLYCLYILCYSENESLLKEI